MLWNSGSFQNRNLALTKIEKTLQYILLHVSVMILKHVFNNLVLMELVEMILFN